MTLPSGTVHLHDVGSGPPLLLLHGGGPGASAWSNFGGNVAALAAAHRLLLVDQPGYGGTPMPEGLDEHYLPFTARLLVELLDALEVERAHLLGNSLGTGTAVRLLLDYPQRFDRVVLMGPAGVISPGQFTPRPTHGFRMVQEYYDDPSRERMVAFLRELAYDPALITEELIDERYAATLDPQVAAGAKRMLTEYARPEFSAQLQLWRDLPRVQHEVLITWGLNDRVNPWDGALFAMQALRNVRLHVWSKCGHWAQIERRAEFERLVLDFLEGGG